jgi:hypothetical protein
MLTVADLFSDPAVQARWQQSRDSRHGSVPDEVWVRHHDAAVAVLAACLDEQVVMHCEVQIVLEATVGGSLARPRHA